MTDNNITLLELIDRMESDLKKIKTLVRNGSNVSKRTTSTYTPSASMSDTVSVADDSGIKIIEGIFDGYFMIGSDAKKYPVPMNYSSKSKLIQGDHLKLRIMSDGSLQYKVIKPAERTYVKAILIKHEDGRFQAVDDYQKRYNLNQAAVTFFAGDVGDEASIIVPLDDKADYAAIETIIK